MHHSRQQAFLEGQDWPCTYLADAGTHFHYFTIVIIFIVMMLLHTADAASA